MTVKDIYLVICGQSKYSKLETDMVDRSRITG